VIDRDEPDRAAAPAAPSGPPEAERRQRPHLVWTSLVAAGVALLAGLAWWVWSGPAEGEAGSTDGAAEVASGESRSPAERTGGIEAPGGAHGDRIDDAARAIDAGDLEGARELLAEIEDEHGWSDALDRLTRRLERREGALRRTVRPLVVHVDGLRLDGDGPDEVFVRASVAGRDVWCSRWFDVDGGRASFTLRTTAQEGFALRFYESGGWVGGPDALGEAVAIGPLATEGCGVFPLAGSGAFVAGDVRYEASPFPPGLARDDPPPEVADDAGAIATALDRALDEGRLVDAEGLLDALRTAAPDHPDLAFLANETAGLRAARERVQQSARLVVIELGCDPDVDGDLWSSGGDDPSLRASVVGEDGDAVGRSGGAGLRTWLAPDAEAPAENVIEVRARGDEPLRLRVVDTSPTFSSAEVGEIDLGLTLADLPDGTGTLTLERDPRVMLLPADDGNRLRRVVLRWTVER